MQQKRTMFYKIIGLIRKIKKKLNFILMAFSALNQIFTSATPILLFFR